MLENENLGAAWMQLWVLLTNKNSSVDDDDKTADSDSISAGLFEVISEVGLG